MFIRRLAHLIPKYYYINQSGFWTQLAGLSLLSYGISQLNTLSQRNTKRSRFAELAEQTFTADKTKHRESTSKRILQYQNLSNRKKKTITCFYQDFALGLFIKAVTKLNGKCNTGLPRNV